MGEKSSMNIAIVFAGGVGKRMKTKSKPKQFLNLFGDPIIVHTLRRFEACQKIDKNNSCYAAKLYLIYE